LTHDVVATASTRSAATEYPEERETTKTSTVSRSPLRGAELDSAEIAK